jgi:hypothetical protein
VDIAGISKDHANQPARHLGRYPSRHGEGSDSGGCGCGCGVLGGRHATRWSDSRDNPRVGRTKGRDVRGEKEEFRALQSNKRNDKVRGSARLKPLLAKPVLPCLVLPCLASMAGAPSSDHSCLPPLPRKHELHSHARSQNKCQTYEASSQAN